jgi:hypothetical protein
MNQAPSFFLTAIGAARVVGGPPGPSTPLLLIFHGRAGSDMAFEINAAVRERFPSTDQLLVASIIDLRHIPSYMRSAVELTLAAAYRQAAKRIPATLDPTEYVIIVPDWEGEVTTSFAMVERINDIGFVVVTNPWIIYGSYTGEDAATVAVTMVADAINRRSYPTLYPTSPE